GGCIDGAPGEEPYGPEEQTKQASQEQPASAEPGDVDVTSKTTDKTLTTLSTWECLLPEGQVSIWWGYTPNDAIWACNSWKSACGNAPGGCTVDLNSGPTTWNCLLPEGQVTISWGHTPADAIWACNNWKSACGNAPGGCVVAYITTSTPV